MCSTCGCNQPSDAVTITLIGEEEHGHEHTHEHSHGHAHNHGKDGIGKDGHDA